MGWALSMSFYTYRLCLESYILLFSFSIAMDGNNFIKLEHPKSFFLSSEKAYNRFLLIFLYSLTTLGAISIIPMSNPFKERVCSFHCTYMDFYMLAFLKFKNNLIIITNAKCGLLIKITCHWLKDYLRKVSVIYFECTCEVWALHFLLSINLMTSISSLIYNICKSVKCYWFKGTWDRVFGFIKSESCITLNKCFEASVNTKIICKVNLSLGLL